ncbi:MAG: ABC-F type ribosomal protection protein [Clostridiaceae bacterium]|nr:ABC-F type ribosomal protection protein [Clostridiaceae bacterium]
MSEIVLRDIHKYYGTHHVLKGVSLEIYENTAVGLIGKNGAGKTTLFKIISGQETFDKGELFISRGRRIGVLDQIPEYKPGTTVYDVINSAFDELHSMRERLNELERKMAADNDPVYVKQYGALLSEFESRGGYMIETSIKRVCNGLGIDSDMQKRLFQDLSGGEKTRVNLARIILMDTHILLLDEPTNHLDINAVEWLEDYLETFSGTVVVISHDRYFLDRVADRIIEIEDGTAISYEGNYSKYAILKEQRRIEQLKQYEQEQKKIKQLEAAVKRMHDWANRSDNPKLHKRAFSMEKRLERMQSNATPMPKKERKLSQTFTNNTFSGTEVLSLKGIHKSFEQRMLLKDINLLVKKDDHVALIGNNGTGKTTLLKIITGEIKADSGHVYTGPSVKIAYLPQIVTFDEPGLSMLEVVRNELRIDEGSARNLLARFLFTGDEAFKPVGSLSGGEKSRLKLCILMQRDVNFLILDEPTNHLDIASREWIEEVLSEFEGTILFISHDRYFIRKFANVVCELEDGMLYYFDGGYDEYRQWKQYVQSQKLQLEKNHKVQEKTKTDNRIKRPSPKSLEKKLAKVENELAAIEERLALIEKEMEVHSSDYERLNELLSEKKTLEEKQEEVLNQWVSIQNEYEKMENSMS